MSASRMVIGSPLFEAFLECPTKCWLRSCAEPNAGNTYAEWARAQNDAYYEAGRDRLLAMRPEGDCAIAPPISKYTKDAKWRLAIDVHSLTKNSRRSLAFDALVFSEAVGREISLGIITHGVGHATVRVKLSSLTGEVHKRIKDITLLLADN